MIRLKILIAIGLVFSLSMANLFAAGNGLSDGYAKVSKVRGAVMITKKGNPIEQTLKKGDLVQAGDTLVTLQGCEATLVFDDQAANVIQIPENSKATLVSLEPTEIEIEHGSLISVVDHLEVGGSWKVKTAAAVAAVRGTVFIVKYGLSTGEYYAATLDVPEDGKESAIEIRSLTGAGMARVIEGKSLRVAREGTVDQAHVQDLDAAEASSMKNVLREVLELRPQEEAEEETVESVVLAEFTETVCNAQGEKCAVKTCRMTAAGKVCDF